MSGKRNELAEARRAYEAATRVYADAERMVDSAEKELEKARAAYEQLLGKDAAGRQIRAGSTEADGAERQLEADRARARELFLAAGKPVPAWLS